MAVVDLKSGPLTNTDADPRTLNNGAVEGGRMRESVGTVETNADDDIGSTYRFFKVPSNARVSSVLLDCDAITSGAADFGIYDTTENDGAVVDADFFASAQSIASALEETAIQNESGVYGKEDAEKFLWEALGLTEDPNKDYHVCATLTAATTAAGTVTLRCRYAV